MSPSLTDTTVITYDFVMAMAKEDLDSLLDDNGLLDMMDCNCGIPAPPTFTLPPPPRPPPLPNAFGVLQDIGEDIMNSCPHYQEMLNDDVPKQSELKLDVAIISAATITMLLLVLTLIIRRSRIQCRPANISKDDTSSMLYHELSMQITPPRPAVVTAVGSEDKPTKRALTFGFRSKTPTWSHMEPNKVFTKPLQSNHQQNDSKGSKADELYHHTVHCCSDTTSNYTSDAHSSGIGSPVIATYRQPHNRQPASDYIDIDSESDEGRGTSLPDPEYMPIHITHPVSYPHNQNKVTRDAHDNNVPNQSAYQHNTGLASCSSTCASPFHSPLNTPYFYQGFYHFSNISQQAQAVGKNDAYYVKGCHNAPDTSQKNDLEEKLENFVPVHR
ncbi:unnamed protein product [Meganyctiphanes norvegica]|uniref:Uncharacterized protein n=1 Tax=Meganyctiphanes norvegica TaxID=48144 RepID=A0AAV2PI47_MEGNR